MIAIPLPPSLRGPTAEQIFADRPGIEVSSAGTNHDAFMDPVLIRLLESRMARHLPAGIGAAATGPGAKRSHRGA